MNDMHRMLAEQAAAEAGRLAEVVDDLTERRAIAEAQLRLVEDWSAARLMLLRSALQVERFADVAGYTAELERAEAELGVVQELRRRLTGEHT